MKWNTLCVALLFCLAAGVAGAADPISVNGTVVSSDSSQLVIDTADGRRTFMVDGTSNLPAGLVAGSRVSVSYHDMGSGRFHVASATMDTAAAPAEPMVTRDTTGTTAPTTTPAEVPPAASTDTSARGTATTPPVASTDTPVRSTTPAAPADTDTDTTSADTPATTTGRNLPATASPLPLVGLVGLLALAGGVAARYIR
jgi:hypothetical protein